MRRSSLLEHPLRAGTWQRCALSVSLHNDAENQLSQDWQRLRTRGHSAPPPLPAHSATRKNSVPPPTAARVEGALVFADTLVDWRAVLAASVQASFMVRHTECSFRFTTLHKEGASLARCDFSAAEYASTTRSRDYRVWSSFSSTSRSFDIVPWSCCASNGAEASHCATLFFSLFQGATTALFPCAFETRSRCLCIPA
jgi:hypothetical protein